MCHKVLCTFHQLHLFTCSNVNMYHACFINKYNTTHDPSLPVWLQNTKKVTLKMLSLRISLGTKFTNCVMAQ